MSLNSGALRVDTAEHEIVRIGDVYIGCARRSGADLIRRGDCVG
jgi:hypothetical protein